METLERVVQRAPDIERVVQRATRLLDQQMWCLGRDCDPALRLLERRAFIITRGPPGTATQYTAERWSGRLHLWSFGALWSDAAGSFFIDRGRFEPLAVHAEPWPHAAHALADLGELRRSPDGWSAAMRIALAFAEHERWVLDHFGAGLREAQLKSRSRARVVGPEELPALWDAVASAFASHAEVRPWHG